MKQKPFINSLRLSLGALALTFALVSCQKKSADVAIPSDSEEAASSSRSKPGSVPVVNLRVTVRDAAGDKITSDGGGNYIHGSQGVQVYFSQSGLFQFNSQPNGNPNAQPVRWLNFNNDSPYQVIINPPVTGILKGTFISSGSSALQGTYIPLQSLAVNQTECITLTTGMGNIYGVNFHRGTEDIPTSPTAYMVVTRTSSTTWTMTPVGACSANSNIAALKEASTGNLYGYWNMPFSFTLTAI